MLNKLDLIFLIFNMRINLKENHKTVRILQHRFDHVRIYAVWLRLLFLHLFLLELVCTLWLLWRDRILISLKPRWRITTQLEQIQQLWRIQRFLQLIFKLFITPKSTSSKHNTITIFTLTPKALQLQTFTSHQFQTQFHG